MKRLVSLMIVSLMSGAAVADVNANTANQDKNRATYYRVWQGFQRADIGHEGMMKALPSFMEATVRLYEGTALNNYIVVIPPKTKPDYIPDELALVALKSEAAYRKIRATPEGQKYAERHWDLFDKTKSKSIQDLVNCAKVRPAQLQHNWAYDVIGEPVDWSSGATYVFIGTRKANLKPNDFLKRLQTHIVLARDVMQPKGLRGYMVIANENYEIAYLNWESEVAHNKAGETADGKGVFQDAGEIMDVLMYQLANPYKWDSDISEGAAYTTLLSDSNYLDDQPEQ